MQEIRVKAGYGFRCIFVSDCVEAAAKPGKAIIQPGGSIKMKNQYRRVISMELPWCLREGILNTDFEQ